MLPDVSQLSGIPLKHIRKSFKLRQIQVAERLGMTQPGVARIEGRPIGSMEVSTLRRYVESMGGELHIVAEFVDQSYVLSDLEPE